MQRVHTKPANAARHIFEYIRIGVHRAFEEVEDVGVRAMDYPELRRQRSLEADMDYYFGT